MNWDAFLHLIPYFLSFGISFSVGLYAWKRRTIACALTFAIFAYAEAFYTFIYIFELISSSLKYKILMDNIEWIPALIAPVTLFRIVFIQTKTYLANNRWNIYHFRSYDHYG